MLRLAVGGGVQMLPGFSGLGKPEHAAGLGQ